MHWRNIQYGYIHDYYIVCPGLELPSRSIKFAPTLPKGREKRGWVPETCLGGVTAWERIRPANLLLLSV